MIKAENLKYMLEKICFPKIFLRSIFLKKCIFNLDIFEKSKENCDIRFGGCYDIFSELFPKERNNKLFFQPKGSNYKNKHQKQFLFDKAD